MNQEFRQKKHTAHSTKSHETKRKACKGLWELKGTESHAETSKTGCAFAVLSPEDGGRRDTGTGGTRGGAM